MHAVCSWLTVGLIALALHFPQVSGAAALPERITLDSLEKLYSKVDFDHASHIKMIKDCGVCHHHTTGTLVNDANCIRCHKNSSATQQVACKSCHSVNPFTAETMQAKGQDPTVYHNDKPGLKGAYHQACLGCHTRMKGPTGCQDCHARKPEGDALFHAGAYAPQKPAGKKHGQH